MNTAAVSASPPPASLGIVRDDFPAWLPPMLVKELRQGLRTRGFVAALVIFQLVMLFLMLIALSQSAARPGGAGGASATSGFFFALIFAQLIIVTPARALGGLQHEIESRSLDLLLLTHLDAWRIVLGKWISLCAQAALLLVAMLPYLVVRYFTDNANVLVDLLSCLLLLALSGLLSAGALCASGIAKILRIVLVIGLIGWSLGMLGMFGSQFFGLRLSGGGMQPVLSLLASPFDLLNGAVLTAYFLVGAVRNIAPPAENHAFFTRVLPIAALVLAPVLAVFGAHELAVRQLYFGGSFLAFVLFLELLLGGTPTAAQWREWRGSALLRGVGCASLPGWPSATLYGTVGLVLWCGLALTVMPDGTMAARETAWYGVQLGVLAFAAVLFPAVAQALVAARGVPGPVVFSTAILTPALLTALALWLGEDPWGVDLVRNVMTAVPVASVFFVLPGVTADPLAQQIGLVVAVLVILLALGLTRPYWHQLRLYAARDRSLLPS